MMRARFARFGAMAVLAVSLAGSSCRIGAAATLPEWLKAEPNVSARVDVAPWVTPDEPEAALTESRASAERDYGADTGRPPDVIYRAIGVRVRIVRVLPGGRSAQVHGLTERGEAYAPLDRLVPEIPRGTALTVAGGFGGFADFFAQLVPPPTAPARLPNGTRLSALDTDVAPFDATNSDLVRLHVRVMSGPLRLRTGWIAVAYTGLPEKHVTASDGVAAKACSCRPVQFAVQRP